MMNLKKIILITGATGFLGGYIVEKYLSRGWNVHIVVRNTSKLRGPAANLPSRNIHFIKHSTKLGILQNQINLILQNTQPSIVIHLASLFVVEHTSNDIDSLIESNVLFGAKLLEAMRLSGVRRIINVGTPWQLYNKKFYNPVNLYAATKQAFSDILDYYVSAEGFNAITFLISDTYGENDERNKLINLIKNTLKSGVPLEMSKGEQLIDLIHASDVAECFELAGVALLENNSNVHNEFYCGSGSLISLKQLIQKIEYLLGKSLPILWGKKEYRRREVMKPWIGMPFPNWEPQISLIDGLSKIFIKNQSHE